MQHQMQSCAGGAGSFYPAVAALFLLPLLPAVYGEAPPPTAATSTAGGPAEVEVACDPPPQLHRGHLCVPVKWLESELGAQVTPLEPRKVLIRYYGQTMLLTEGSETALVNQNPASLPISPFVSASRLYMPVSPLSSLWGIQVESLQAERLRLILPQSRVTGIRHSTSPERVRVVIDLTNPAIFSTQISDQAVSVVLRPVSAAADAPLTSALPPNTAAINDVLLRDVAVEFAPLTGARVDVRLSYGVPVKVFSLGDPARIVIDCEKVFREVEKTPLSHGGHRIGLRVGTQNGPVRAVAVQVGLRQHSRTASCALIPVLAGDRLTQTKTTRDMAVQIRAIVATNGGYFAGNGSPVGTLVVGGEWIKTSELPRTGLIVTRSGEVMIDALRVRGEARMGANPPLRVDGLNTRNGGGGVLLAFTGRWGESVELRPGETALLVSQGTVSGLVTAPLPDSEATDGAMAASPSVVSIPEGGFALCSSGALARQLAAAETGSSCSMTWSFDNDYGDVLHALSGGPRLVKDGKVCVTAAEEKFRNDVAVGRAPRTAIGITGNRELLLLAVDGRRPSHSIGLTLPELAQWMIDLGATEAMNLDGGGSTTLVINGKVEIPSTGTERRVSNALAVVPATGK